jgi:hypothetical protein
MYIASGTIAIRLKHPRPPRAGRAKADGPRRAAETRAVHRADAVAGGAPAAERWKGL